MKIQDATEKAGQILDEERMFPTVHYTSTAPVVSAAAPLAAALGQRGAQPRTVQEHPENFIFKSTNFDLLCSLLDQVPEQDRPALFAVPISRISSNGSYRDTSNEVSRAGE